MRVPRGARADRTFLPVREGWTYLVTSSQSEHRQKLGRAETGRFRRFGRIHTSRAECNHRDSTSFHSTAPVFSGSSHPSPLQSLPISSTTPRGGGTAGEPARRPRSGSSPDGRLRGLDRTRTAATRSRIRRPGPGRLDSKPRSGWGRGRTVPGGNGHMRHPRGVWARSARPPRDALTGEARLAKLSHGVPLRTAARRAHPIGALCRRGRQPSRVGAEPACEHAVRGVHTGNSRS
jgi:hypothetical protein